MKRNDVRTGLAIGGVRLAVLIAYALVVGGNGRKKLAANTNPPAVTGPANGATPIDVAGNPPASTNPPVPATSTPPADASGSTRSPASDPFGPASPATPT